MIETIFISVIAVFLAYLARFKQIKWGLEVAFILLTIFISLRYDWGNDYSGYLQKFQLTTSYSSFDSEIFNIEPGWIFLNYISKPIGFFGFTILLTIFEYYVLYRLIKKYVPKNWYWLAVFIFTFNCSLMVVTSSMMRQFLAMSIFIITIEYIISKRWLISILLILLASLFHSSALILLPFSFFGYLNISLTKLKPYIWFCVYLFLYFFAVDLFGKYFNMLIELEQFKDYEVYVGEKNVALSTGAGVIINMILYFAMLTHQQYQVNRVKVLFILFAFSVFFNLFADIAPLTGRLGFYFSILSIVCYPLMFKEIKNIILRNAVLGIYILLLLKTFFDFFSFGSIWHKDFYNYQSIFSASGWL